MTAPTGFLVDRNNERMKIGVAVDAASGTPTMVTRDGNGAEVLTAFGGTGSSTFAALTDAATANIPGINTPTATALAALVASSTVGQPNGVAGLDGAGHVPTAQLPSSVLGALNYQGTWNATTNTPTLTSGSGTKGFYYTVATAGSTTLDGISQWNVGDHAVYNGTAWEKIDGIASEVISVAGRTGVVTLAVADVSGAAPLASPALTGLPTTPTAAADTSTTQLASTAFVLGQLGSSNPIIDGTAAAGTSTRGAREDHVHPTDTTRANVVQIVTAQIYVATVADGVLFNVRQAYGLTLTDIYVKTASGTTSVQVQKNGSNVGSANSASSTEAHQGSLSTAYADGDYLGIQASSTASALGLAITLKFTRTLAA